MAATLATIIHGKSGSIDFSSIGSGLYGTQCFDVSVDITNDSVDVSTFGMSNVDFTQSIPGNTQASGSFSVYADSGTAIGLGDLHFDHTSSFPSLNITLGATVVTMDEICITGVTVSMDANSVPTYVCSFVSVGDFTVPALPLP